MSPLFVELLLHFYKAPAPEEPLPGRFINPASKEATERMLEEGLLAAVHGRPPRFELTEKGRALVGMILSVPVPQKAWVDPRTQQIIAIENP